MNKTSYNDNTCRSVCIDCGGFGTWYSYQNVTICDDLDCFMKNKQKIKPWRGDIPTVTVLSKKEPTSVLDFFE